MAARREYFFRVRAVNEIGSSGWSDSVSVVVGESPAAPTTWSSTTTAIVGEPIYLYWVHNAKDNSKETFADLEIYINDSKLTRTIENPNSNDENAEDTTHYYILDTTNFADKTIVKWRVRTAGITKQYGDWSVQRTIDVFAPASLSLSLTDKDGEPIKLDLPSGDEVFLKGRIDRIDTAEIDGNIYIRIIDYKSGNSKDTVFKFNNACSLK